MQLYGALILFLTLSTACGLRCYTCITTDPKSCTEVLTCPDSFNRCFSLNFNGVITKGCQISNLCVSPMSCCEGDLCNNAIPTGPSVILLLVSSAIITLFL
ncbi:lymphocyte antigen 6G-like [Thunnus albacares]|uniref:lymphocyte antigen 6G-like n=1 Tax=Thunnus maccoyii TaxID=8240 RepID=UPI001C4B502B|nr:lymphocyte antigen 6G-like [Thunnus maccoyii]XP_044231597.1 lymphocyte antigen 6G-like [Thunnus albacares]